jgi:hypothetical protein
MGEGRGKKAKKAADWKVQLGIKEFIFGGLGVAGLVMMSFALGTLAGRGDIYRVLYNWGLLSPDSNKTGQVWYQAPPPPAAPVVALASPPAQEPEAPHAAKPGPPQTSAHERAPAPALAPVKGAIVPPVNPVAAPAKKKSTKPEAKGKEDKLEKIRQEVASKLKFQNSLDLAATRGTHSGDKGKKAGDKETTAAARPPASPMVVARYRDAGQARARLAHMQKQGDKVFLKEGKDGEGQYFAICRQVGPSPAEPKQVAQAPAKKAKTEAQPAKPPAEKGTPKKKEAGR